MTTLIYFDPQSTVNFQFNPVLDGINYIAVCTWNSYSSRYYISIYDSSRTLIVSRPIIGSSNDYDINLVFGYFTSSTLVYRASTGNFEINP